MDKFRQVIGYIAGRPIFAIGGGEPTPAELLLRVVQSLDAEHRQVEEQPPSDAELAEARAGLLEALASAVEGDDPPDLEAARALRAAVDRIDAESATRQEARQAAREEARALLDGIQATEEPPAETPAEDPPAEEAEQTEREPQAVTASLADAINRSARRKIDRVVAPEPSDVMVAAVGPAQGRHLDHTSSLRDVANVFTQYASSVKRGSAVLVHMERMYPESRSLGLSAEENTRIVDEITAPRAITAAGGICEPLPADFSIPICGDRGRPIWSALPKFRADRGGARFAPSITVADLESAISIWDSTTDETPGTTTKPCPRIECEAEVEAKVDAIVACLTVGNFQARFNPEFWRSRLDLLMVAHDRIAEQTLYTTIETGSTQVTYADSGHGTVVNVLQFIDKAVAGLRSRHRLIGTQFRTIAPSWLLDAMRAHLATQAPAGSFDPFAAADATLNNFFMTRRISPIWSPDVDEFGAQGAGALLDFPGGDVDIVVYPEGTWLGLDGGTLDLGTEIHDSTLNSTNDRQAFIETFEQVVMRGCESLSGAITVDEDCICSVVS